MSRQAGTATDFVEELRTTTTAFIAQRQVELTAIDPQTTDLVKAVAELTTQGKKLRPLLAWLGWRSAATTTENHEPALTLGVALELFQSAALIHDDVVDRSETRRGMPALHRKFAGIHRDRGYSADPDHFGISAAILAGDLALSWASEAFHQAYDQALQPERAAQSNFQLMHTQVITGQYLDVHHEVSPAAGTESQALERARTVLRFKAAKYSTQYPMIIGCALAGGNANLQQLWGAAALPLGEAFQLRDDLLGVFGDPEVTGKPVGDDLREGKRTELIAYGLFRSTTAEATFLESVLGNADAQESEIERAREILLTSGAVELVEKRIATLEKASTEKLTDVARNGVPQAVIADFEAVAAQLVERRS